MIHCANLGDRKRAFCGPTAVSILTGVDVGHIEEIIHEERNRFEYIKRILHDLPFTQARAILRSRLFQFDGFVLERID